MFLGNLYYTKIIQNWFLTTKILVKGKSMGNRYKQTGLEADWVAGKT
jgi:hypothetical protein